MELIPVEQKQEKTMKITQWRLLLMLSHFKYAAEARNISSILLKASAREISIQASANE